MKHEFFPDVFEKVEPVETIAPRTLSRRERIDRWAELLEEHRGPLLPLQRVEYLTHEARRALRGDHTPLTVAFRDPVLRSAGLSGDTLGEAVDFFRLSEEEAHHLLCDCHYHGAMTPNSVASRLRAVSRRERSREIFAAVRGRISGWFGR